MKAYTVSVFRLRHKKRNGQRQVAFRIRSEYLDGTSLDVLPTLIRFNRISLTDEQYETLKSAGYYGDIKECKNELEIFCERIIKRGYKITKQSIFEEYIKYRYESYSRYYNKFIRSDELKTKADDHKRIDLIEDAIASDIMMNDEDDSYELFLEDHVKIIDEEQKELNYLQSKKSTDFSKRLIADYEHLGSTENNLLVKVGSLFLIKKPNGSFEYSKQYRGILKELYDFLLASNHSNRLGSLDRQFFVDLLLYIRDAGIIKSSLNRTPHELSSGLYDSTFLESEREDCSHDTFKGKVKAINKLVKMARIHLNLSLNFDDFRASDFVVSSTPKIGARAQERLEVEEVNELMNTTFQEDHLNVTRDVFLFLVFSGGLRGIKNSEVSFQSKRFMLVLHHKTKLPVENPIPEELKLVLERNNWEVPEMKEDDISKNLKAIAKNLNWTREINYINTSVKRNANDSFFNKKELKDCISQKFARKTFVHYMRMVYNLTDRQIIEYTGHSSIATLEHYAGAPRLREKENELKRGKLTN